MDHVGRVVIRSTVVICMLYGVVGTLFDTFTGADTLGRHRHRAITHYHFQAASLDSS